MKVEEKIEQEQEQREQEEVQKVKEEDKQRNQQKNQGEENQQEDQQQNQEEEEEEIEEIFPCLNELNQRNSLIFYDICSGKGISSFFLSFLFPNSKIIMIDNNSSIKLQHLSLPQCQNIQFYNFNIYSEECFQFLSQKQIELNSLTLNSSISLLFGLHLCGTLSLRLCTLFNDLNFFSIVILSPCCLPTNKKSNSQHRQYLLKNWNFKQRNKREKIQKSDIIHSNDNLTQYQQEEEKEKDQEVRKIKKKSKISSISQETTELTIKKNEEEKKEEEFTSYDYWCLYIYYHLNRVDKVARNGCDGCNGGSVEEEEKVEENEIKKDIVKDENVLSNCSKYIVGVREKQLQNLFYFY